MALREWKKPIIYNRVEQLLDVGAKHGSNRLGKSERRPALPS